MHEPGQFTSGTMPLQSWILRKYCGDFGFERVWVGKGKGNAAKVDFAADGGTMMGIIDGVLWRVVGG